MKRERDCGACGSTHETTAEHARCLSADIRHQEWQRERGCTCGAKVNQGHADNCGFIGITERDLKGRLAALPGDEWCCGACGTTRKWLTREKISELIWMSVVKTTTMLHPLVNADLIGRINHILTEDITKTVMRYSPAKEIGDDPALSSRKAVK